MNADNTPSEMAGHMEIASYIVRQTENKEFNQNKNKKSNGKVLLVAGVFALMLMFAFGWYGIEKKAAAHEPLMSGAAEETKVSTESQPADMQIAEKGLPSENGATAAEAEKACEEENTDAERIIPDSTELFGRIAKQEVAAGHEDNLSGLLWNYELIADIQKRVAEKEAEAEREEYRELLVTMGMDENYVSQDPELPEYLTKTYNPLMDIELSEQEISELLRLVEAEAPAEDIYGKILVANVVLNRVNNETMANTVTGVIYEKIGGSAQFSPTAISWYWNSIQVTDSTREAVARCLSGEDYSNGALYFHAWERNPDKHKTSPWMSKLECLFTHGGHRFFR